jgi:cyclic-di-GMP-binding protein
MPSFDVVSEIDAHELSNAVDQANREVETRFDFKGSGAKYELEDFVVKLSATSDFQLKQMIDILIQKVARRGIDVNAISPETPELALNSAKQRVTMRHGIDTDTARKLVKLVKGSKIKVQAAIQGDQVRVSGKKRDDLQQVIRLLKEEKLDLPLQFTNFRD